MTSTTLPFSSLAEENKYLKEQNQQLEALVEGLQTTIRNQQHQLEGLIKRVYGKSSEKLDPNQLLMQASGQQAKKNF